jgi:vacuolar-type H+-ATPase subunit I/STV1
LEKQTWSKLLLKQSKIQTLRSIMWVLNQTWKTLLSLLETLTRLKKQARKYLTVQGEMPDRFSAQLNQLKVAEVSAHNNKVRQAVNELDDAMSFVNKNGGIFNNQDQSRILNTVNDYLFAEDITRGPKPVSRETVKTRAENELKEIDDIIGKEHAKKFVW